MIRPFSTSSSQSRSEPPDECICILDDDPAVLRAVAWLVTAEGFGVYGFQHPQDFLAHAAGHPVPLVIMDVWMDGMSGLEVLANLRTFSPTTQAILMTANTDPSTRSRAEALGAAAFFLKPFDTEVFANTVSGVMAAIAS
jgi:two-component system response regulator HydG